jgi:hypothetical protein
MVNRVPDIAWSCRLVTFRRLAPCASWLGSCLRAVPVDLRIRMRRIRGAVNGSPSARVESPCLGRRCALSRARRSGSPPRPPSSSPIRTSAVPHATTRPSARTGRRHRGSYPEPMVVTRGSLAPLVEIVPPLTPGEVRRCSWHLHLPQVGEAGQRRHRNARVCMAGAGGLGAPVLLNLRQPVWGAWGSSMTTTWTCPTCSARSSSPLPSEDDLENRCGVGAGGWAWRCGSRPACCDSPGAPAQGPPGRLRGRR